MPPPSSESDGVSAESSGDIAMLRTEPPPPGVESERSRRPASASASTSASSSSSSIASMATARSTVFVAAAFFACKGDKGSRE